MKNAIEEYHAKQLEEKANKDMAITETDEEFRERLKKIYREAGYSEASIEKILEQELDRRIYIKVHKEHMAPETLDEHNLPWEWDEVSSSVMIFDSRSLFNTVPA